MLSGAGRGGEYWGGHGGQYVAGSQQAFAELVARHANWVYCAARRRVGDAHLAEDVTQAVFILLAQKAWKIGPEAAIGPWLLETTRHVSMHALRARERRMRHERAAAGREIEVAAPDAEVDRREIAQLNLSGAKVALPTNLIEPALKRGRVIFSWHHLRSWIRPTPPGVSVVTAV